MKSDLNKYIMDEYQKTGSEVESMNYLITGMVADIVCIAAVVFSIRKGVMLMVEAMLFMVGFTGITTIYEIVKTTKSTKSNSVRHEAEKIGRKFK